MAIDDGAGDDGRVEAVGALDQPFAAGRQVVDDLGPAQAQVVVVQDVDVGLHADLQQAAIVQPDRRGIVRRQALDAPRHREQRPRPRSRVQWVSV